MLSAGGQEMFIALLAKRNHVQRLMHKKMLRLIFQILTIMCMVRIQVTFLLTAIKRQFNSTILDVYYVDPQTRIAIPLYTPSWPWMSFGAHWSSWHAKYLKSDFAHHPVQDGVYVFRTWNQSTERNESYMLTPKHLLEALQLKSLEAIWAFSDIGIVTQLNKFLEAKSKTSSDYQIFDLTIDGRPALQEMKPYMGSIFLPDNVNAHVLAIWFTFMRWEQGAKDASLAYPFDKVPSVVMTDDDLEEATFTDKQALFVTINKKEE